MSAQNTKENIKEVGLDAKALAVSSVSLVVDTFKIPVSICRDIRDSYLKRKAVKQYLETHEVVIVEKKETKKTQKPVVAPNEA